MKYYFNCTCSAEVIRDINFIPKDELKFDKSSKRNRLVESTLNLYFNYDVISIIWEYFSIMLGKKSNIYLNSLSTGEDLLNFKRTHSRSCFFNDSWADLELMQIMQNIRVINLSQVCDLKDNEYDLKGYLTWFDSSFNEKCCIVDFCYYPDRRSFFNNVICCKRKTMTNFIEHEQRFISDNIYLTDAYNSLFCSIFVNLRFFDHRNRRRIKASGQKLHNLHIYSEDNKTDEKNIDIIKFKDYNDSIKHKKSRILKIYLSLILIILLFLSIIF
jgi:hypothetical protein